MEGKRNILRQKSFALPVVNPFVHTIELSNLDKIRIIIMSVTVAPIRLLLVFILMVFNWMLAKIFIIGMPLHSEHPVGKFRRALFQILALIGRLQFFVLGFMWITVKGKRASGDEARIQVIAPHSSFFDTLLWFSTYPMQSAVSRVENSQAPFMGTMMRTQQPVLVTRKDPNSRQKTIQAIHNRATSKEDWPQVAMFPEGTCTNRKALITFKAGAFIPGCPVQPVLIRYPNSLDTYTWTMHGPGGFKLLWLTLCQFYSRFEVEFLPVYYPSEEEIKYPKKFARNVRQVMADALDVPSTDHTFEDCLLMYHARSRNLPMEAGLIEFTKISKKLGMDIDEMRGLLDEFAEIARFCQGGMMGIEEFSRHLNLPITDELTTLFEMYDRNGNGFIDFREYVIGMSLVSQAAVTEKTVKLAFKVFDRDGDGFVTHNELDQVLKSVFGKEFETTSIYEKIDTEKTGKVDYDQFYSFAKKRPEYAKLFMSYTDLEQDDLNTKCVSNVAESQDRPSSSVTHRARPLKSE